MRFRKTAGLLAGVMGMMLALSGCGGSAEQATTGAQAPAETQQTTAGQEKESGEPAGGAANTMEGTLKLTGPGLFTTVGEKGAVDIITGIQKPGYEVVVNRWNELYPNVKLEIEPTPWDNWKAVMQTAALSGDVDVLIHGASLVAISEPMTEYFKKDPGIEELISMPSVRKNEDDAPMTEYVPYGITVTVNPVVVVLDKQIFEHYGVAVPDSGWTFEDLLSIAEATTGTDPVTGEATYGISLLKASESNKNWLWAARGFNAEIFDFGEKMKDTKVDFTTEKVKDTLNYLQKLGACTSPDYIEGLDLGKAYKSENNLAMIVSEEAFNVYNQVKAAGLTDRYMFLPLPAITDGEFKGVTASHMGDWNMSICNTSKNKELAWEFLKFMVTDPVVQQWLVDTYSIPNNLEGLKLLDGTMEPGYYEAVNEIVTTCPKAFSASINDCWDSTNFGTFATDVTSVLNEIFTGNLDADQATGQVQENLDEFLKSLQ